ncbi:MAG: hypothetical protein ACSLEY_02630 [Candidatus Saccharimonadales bacterium]
MSKIELLSSTDYVDDSGEILPFANIETEFDSVVVQNSSIIQGKYNLEEYARQERNLAVFETAERKRREQLLMEVALKNAGVYETLEEHRETQLKLAEIAAHLSMYRGGEKGGYRSRDFQERYQQKSDQVETGARKNHRRLVNQEFPKLYKADELRSIGFDEHDISDDMTQMRYQLMKQYGGSENKKARNQLRKQNK